MMEKSKRQIRFRVSDICNFNCSYCVEHANGTHSNITNINKFIGNISKLNKIENRDTEIFIYGGEPLLAHQLEYLLISLINLNFINYIEIHSNLSIKLNENIKELIQNHNIKFATSIHLEYLKSIDTVMSNIEFLNNINKLNETNIMFNHLNDFNKVINIKKEFKIKKIPASIIPTFQLLEKHTYDKISKLIPELKIADTNIYGLGKVNFSKIQTEYNPFGLNCNCPMDSFIVDYNGNVLICQEDLRIERITPLNLFKDNTLDDLKLLTKPTICKHTRCRCEYEVKKWK